MAGPDDADAAPGPSATTGSVVTWTYVVVNTGDTYLTDVTVTDDLVADAAISCDGGSHVVAGPVAPGGTFTCTATGTAISGGYTNLGNVTGTPSDVDGVSTGEAAVLASDRSHYTGTNPVLPVANATAYPYPNITSAPVPAVAQPVAGEPASPLALTGTNAAALAALGLATIAAGGYVVVAGRRRLTD